MTISDGTTEHDQAELQQLRTRVAVLEQQATAMQGQWQALLAATSEGIYSLDAAGCCTTINQRALDLLGYTVEECLGRDMHTLIHARRPDGSPYPIEDCPIYQALWNGQAAHHLPETLWRKDGTPLLVLSSCVPIQEGDQRGGAVVTIIDLTAQRQAEAAVRTSEQFTRRVLDNLFAFVGVLELDGTLIEVNRAPLAAAGIPASEVLGQKFWDCYWWSYAPEVQAQLREAIGRALLGEVVRYDVPVRMAGDRRMWIDFQLAPLRDEAGRITHLIPSAMDLTPRRQAEMALRESEERFRSTFDNAAVGIAHVAPDGRWLRINQRLCAMTGYSEAELLVRTFQEITHPDDLQADLDLVRQVLAGDIASYTLEKRYIRQDSTILWVNLTVSLVRGVAGSPHYFIAVIEDISARKQVEAERECLLQQLAEREERFRAITNNIAQLAWMTDETGWISWYNQRWFDYTGTTLQEVEGWGWQRVHHPDHVQRVVDKISQAFASGEAWEDTFPLRAKDGTYRWFLSRAIPIRDARGTIRHWFGTNTDITELREAEEQLAAAEARYRVLFQGVGETLLVLNTDGQHLDANPAAATLTGYTLEELRQLPVGNLVALPSEQVECRLAQVAQAGTWQGEVDLRCKDGRLVPVEAMITAVNLPTGPAYLIVLHDISAQRAEAQQQQDFLSMITHDLKGPLTTIRAYAQLLERRQHYDAQALLTIADQTRYLERLIDDLASLARLARGQLVLDRAPIDLRRVIEPLVEHAQATAPQHTIQFVAPARPVQGVWDAGRLAQVFHNLLSNAIKYSPAGGTVTVTVTDQVESVTVVIEDQGLGILPEALPYLFDRFYRAETALRAGIAGTGLGLAICKGLVEAHGGQIRVESRLNQGSTFTIILPRSST